MAARRVAKTGILQPQLELRPGWACDEREREKDSGNSSDAEPPKTRARTHRSQIRQTRGRADRSLFRVRRVEICKAAGVEIGFGSDLLGQLQVDQSREFLIRAEALSPQEILYSATVTNARILKREGELGVIAPGAFADLLVVDGNPMKDLGVLQDQGAHLPAIMKGGVFHKNALGA